MINFRYHLVSLVAVFLALTVGIVMGSTVIDRAIVDGLRQQISDVRDRADRTKAENRDLGSDLDERDAYIEATQRFTVEGRLDGVPVVVVAPRGANADAVRAAATLVQEAGARAPAVLWLEPKWALDAVADAEALAEALGSDRVGRRSTLRANGWSRLAERLGAGGPELAGDVLAKLVNAGFVSLERVGDQGEPAPAAYPGAGARVLLVGSVAAKVEVPGLVVAVARALRGASVPTVVAEEAAGAPDASERGGVVAPIRDDSELSRVVSTVDGLDLPTGRVAAVLALSDLGRGAVGSYGTANGANAPVPAWSPPPAPITTEPTGPSAPATSAPPAGSTTPASR